MKSTTWGRVPCGVRLALALALSFSPLPIVQAQTFTVLHTFTGNPDGAEPLAGLTLDNAGNLYGTTSYGGNASSGSPGTVYRLKRSGSNWTYSILYNFLGDRDGFMPEARVVFGPDGALYGTTLAGGPPTCGQSETGCGTVFRLTPPPTFCPSVSCPWRQHGTYTFDGTDGAWPLGDLVFDQQGNIYGTTSLGGTTRCIYNFPPLPCGTVYKLVGSPGNWTETILHTFQPSGSDAKRPASGVIFDSAGNLYGTTTAGGTGTCSPNGARGCGAIYILEPSGSGWIESLLYSFLGGSDGAYPFGGLVFDHMGNLYGTTTTGGMNGGGTVFQLANIMGTWSLTTLYSFAGSGGPSATLTMDAAGNLYGTTVSDGAYGYGSVFKLTNSGSGWTYTSLHDFTGGSDGGYPYSNVVLDATGRLYGTASAGGTFNGMWCSSGGCGVVWEITP